MLFIFLSVSVFVINFINGQGLDISKSPELLRLKRHYNWRQYNTPVFVRHPSDWGNNDYASHNQHHRAEWDNSNYPFNNVRYFWGDNDYTSYRQYPAEWDSSNYPSYNQHHPVPWNYNGYPQYDDYTGGWGSFDIITYNRDNTAAERNKNVANINGKLLDRQLFTGDTPIFEPQVNPINSQVLQEKTITAPKRRISEIKCDEYLKNRKAREDILKRRNKNVYYVIGGRSTKPGEFPHMGAVGWKAVKGSWIFICGSSLISSKFMLTAGHCSKVSSRYPNIANQSPEIVRLGDENIIDVQSKGVSPYDKKIQRIIVHPQYAPPKKYFDIAILELQNKVIIDKSIQPACLWTKQDTSSLGSTATVTGWGVIETATLRTSPDLQAADVDVLSSNVCDNLLRPLCSRLWCGMAESQICAGKLGGGTDTCQGDSGGPLQVKINSGSESEGAIHYLIGITSFGHGCAQRNRPAVYTRVSSFLDWIENIVWANEKKV